MLTTDLITSIQRRAAVPEAQSTFSQTDFFQMIDEETASKMIPLILEQMEEYYVADFPYNITMNQNAYPMPPRATASMLRDVQIISSTDPDSITPLERLQIESLYASTASNYRVLIKKSGFYIKSNTVYMYPTPNYTQNILNLEYYSRPNSAVDPATCGQITAIDQGAQQLTVSNLPSNITTSTLVDFVKSVSGFECTAIDQVITNISGNILTFSNPLPTILGTQTLSVSIGDYVCQATQTCVVQVPQELLPLLSQYVAVRILSAQGDPNLPQAVNELSVLEKNAMNLIAPRVSGKMKRVTNTRGVCRFV